MAEVQFKQLEGGASGGSSSPSFKKIKFDKKLLFLVGGAVVLLVVLFKKKTAPEAQSVDSVPVDYPGGTPENGVDVQSQLDSFQSIIGSQVDSALTGALSEVGTQNDSLRAEMNDTRTNTVNDFNESYKEQFGHVSEQMTGIGETSKQYTDALNNNLSTTISGLVKQDEAIHVSLDANQVAQKKVDVAQDTKLTAIQKKVFAPVKPKPVAKPTTYTVKKGDTLSEIVGTNNKTTLNTVAKASGISNINKINVGQKIILPASVKKK